MIIVMPKKALCVFFIMSSLFYPDDKIPILKFASPLKGILFINKSSLYYANSLERLPG
jgi:hypothetical protein